jgi:hypothetical protein
VGVKIPKAWSKSINNFVDARQYDEKKHGTPYCPTLGCRQELKHTDAFTRVIDENRREIKVDPYFSRKPSVLHKSVCKYNAPGAVRKLVAMSTLVQTRRQIDPIIAGSDEPEFRLHILMEAVKTNLALSNLVAGQDEEQVFIGRQYVKGRHALKPYMRCARALIALASRISDNEELSSAVSLIHKGGKVSWRDFYYGPDDYQRLYNKLSKDALSHPIAVAVRPYWFNEREPGSPWRTIGCWYQKIIEKKAEKRFVPSLNVRDESLIPPLERLDRTDWALVCGIPQLRVPKNPVSPHSNVYLNLDIVSRGQFTKYSLRNPS